MVFYHVRLNTEEVQQKYLWLAVQEIYRNDKDRPKKDTKYINCESIAFLYKCGFMFLDTSDRKRTDEKCLPDHCVKKFRIDMCTDFILQLCGHNSNNNNYLQRQWKIIWQKWILYLTMNLLFLPTNYKKNINKKCLFICCDLTSNSVILQLYSDDTLVINIKDRFHLHKNRFRSPGTYT